MENNPLAYRDWIDVNMHLLEDDMLAGTPYQQYLGYLITSLIKELHEKNDDSE